MKIKNADIARKENISKAAVSLAVTAALDTSLTGCGAGENVTAVQETEV